MIVSERQPKKRYQGPHVSLPEKDKDESLPGGVGRTPGSAEPGLAPVQVHFEESPPSLLITFHTCIWQKPTSTSINRPPLTPLSPSLPPLCTAAGGARARGHGGAEHVRGWDAGGAGEGVHEGVKPYVDAH